MSRKRLGLRNETPRLSLESLNKKFRYREEDSTLVVLSWCTLWRRTSVSDRHANCLRWDSTSDSHALQSGILPKTKPANAKIFICL